MVPPTFLEPSRAKELLRTSVKHQDKLVELVTELIDEHDWKLAKTGRAAHAVAKLYCPCGGCRPYQINGTSQGLAWQEVRKRVRTCPEQAKTPNSM